jgi:hypothetical protein
MPSCICGEQQIAGASKLADVPADDLDGESVRFLLPARRDSTVTPRLSERYRGVDASARGDSKADSIDTTVDELWGTCAGSVARVQDKPCCIVSQI